MVAGRGVRHGAGRGARRRVASGIAVAALLTLLASPARAACPASAPVDCDGGMCCPTDFPYCCGTVCGQSAACGQPPDAGSAPLVCQPAQAKIAAACAGGACACEDPCTVAADCASGCCSRGRCAPACVCGGGGDWTLCEAVSGPGDSSGGCALAGGAGDAAALAGLVGALGLLRRRQRRG